MSVPQFPKAWQGVGMPCAQGTAAQHAMLPRIAKRASKPGPKQLGCTICSRGCAAGGRGSSCPASTSLRSSAQ